MMLFFGLLVLFVLVGIWGENGGWKILIGLWAAAFVVTFIIKMMNG